MKPEERLASIRSRLQEAFDPIELEVVDESHLHEGHPGAKEGKGHFKVRIVSSRFDGTNPLQRHRLVFEALGEMMYSDIHALSVNAFPPSHSSSNP